MQINKSLYVRLFFRTFNIAMKFLNRRGKPAWVLCLKRWLWWHCGATWEAVQKVSND